MKIYSLDVLLSQFGTSLLFHVRTSLVAQTVKHLSTMRETWVWSLGWEDPLEKEMAIHSSTLAQKIPWTEEPDGLLSMRSQRVGHDWATYVLWRKQQQNHWDATSMQWSNWAKGKASVKAEAPILWQYVSAGWFGNEKPSVKTNQQVTSRNLITENNQRCSHRYLLQYF